jgi:hypothetical protein
MCEESLDATDFGQDSSDKTHNVEMPESFGYLSECDPKFPKSFGICDERATAGET